MANFHYFHPLDNVADDAIVTIQTGTEDADYPAENATDLGYAKIASPSKLEEVTGAWVFDFGAAQRVDAMVLWHNFDASLACSFQGNASNSWGGPTLSTSLTIPSKRADDHTVKVYKDLRSVSGYSTGGFRYWRLNVSGSNSVAIGIKILLLSRIRTTTRNIQWGHTYAEHQTVIDMTTDALVPWAYDLASAPRQLTANFPGTDADAELIKEWFRACAGRVRPTVIVPNPSSPDPFLCRWSNGNVGITAPIAYAHRLEDSYAARNARRMTISFDEISSGDPEWY